MGQRKVRIVVEGYVDKAIGIDIANVGGRESLDRWQDVVAILGEIATEDALRDAYVEEIEK